MSIRSIVLSAISDKNAKALEAYKIAKVCFHLADHSTGWYWLNQSKQFIRDASELRNWIKENEPA